MMFTPGMSPWEKGSQIFRSLGFGMITKPQWRPARLKVLLGAMSVIDWLATSGLMLPWECENTREDRDRSGSRPNK